MLMGTTRSDLGNTMLGANRLKPIRRLRGHERRRYDLEKSVSTGRTRDPTITFVEALVFKEDTSDSREDIIVLYEYAEEIDAG